MARLQRWAIGLTVATIIATAGSAIEIFTGWDIDFLAGWTACYAFVAIVYGLQTRLQ